MDPSTREWISPPAVTDSDRTVNHSEQRLLIFDLDFKMKLSIPIIFSNLTFLFQRKVRGREKTLENEVKLKILKM